jgi:hypothetical protein
LRCGEILIEIFAKTALVRKFQLSLKRLEPLFPLWKKDFTVRDLIEPFSGEMTEAVVTASAFRRRFGRLSRHCFEVSE